MELWSLESPFAEAKRAANVRKSRNGRNDRSPSKPEVSLVWIGGTPTQRVQRGSKKKRGRAGAKQVRC